MPQHILVVDDEAHIQQVLMLKLRNAGYEVTTAVDGEEGLEVALRLKPAPDLVITDFQMPYMSGLELCKALAGNAATAHIPVIMLTARGYALEERDLQIGNLKKVLSKPFSPRAIVDLIHETLGEGDRVAGVCGSEGGPGGAGAAELPEGDVGRRSDAA